MNDFDRRVLVPLVQPPRAALGPMHALAWRTTPESHDDLPPFVRAGSAVRRWRDRWCVVQDDVRALALLQSIEPLDVEPSVARGAPTALAADPLLLPVDTNRARTFDSARGNKRQKLDLEAAVALPDGRLLVFGSGATPVRERIVVISATPLHVEIADARSLYAGIHARTSNGDAIVTNIEGAVVVGHRLRLFQRAVGTTTEATPRYAANLTRDFDLDRFLAWLDHAAAPPQIIGITAYDLGLAEGAVVGFTDAALQQDGTIAFLACAELTGDPVADGRVVATRFGVLDGGAGWQSEIVDGAGVRVTDKLEGLEPAGAPGRFVVVSDADDPALPARIAGLRAGPGIA